MQSMLYDEFTKTVIAFSQTFIIIMIVFIIFLIRSYVETTSKVLSAYEELYFQIHRAD